MEDFSKATYFIEADESRVLKNIARSIWLEQGRHITFDTLDVELSRQREIAESNPAFVAVIVEFSCKTQFGFKQAYAVAEMNIVKRCSAMKGVGDLKTNLTVLDDCIRIEMEACISQ